MKNEVVIDSLYAPNDKLGVEMFGASDWNRLKGRVCGLTNAALSRSYNCTGGTNPNYSALFEVLFRPNRARFAEMLGADAPIDFISADWARGLSKIGSGITEGLNKIPFFTPWISAGRSINSGVASLLKNFGLSSKKAEEVAPTVAKTGLTLGGVLLLGGAAYGVYYLTKKKRKRGK
ncbi:MAG: hypothetical protein J5700_06130 [Treponema sp.]|nr:hypothetical protein [Treponema sp.]